MANIKDIAGQRFGRLIAIKRTEQKKGNCFLWLCKCDCGKEALVPTYFLTHGLRKSCGCLAEGPKENLIGKRFGLLTVISMTGEKRDDNFVWHCRCDCGKTKDTTTHLLNSGDSKSCGCLHIKTARERVEKIRLNNHIDNTNIGAIKSERIPVNNTSGIKGVNWHKGSGKWAARICFQKKSIHLGYYDNLIDAAEARKMGEEKYFKEYLEAKEKGRD